MRWRRRHYSSLFVTKKVQRRTLASGTYPNALLPFHGTGVARSSSRNRRLRTPLSRHAPIATRPVAGPGGSVQCPVAGRRALGHAGSCAPSLSKPPCGGGPVPAGCSWAASLHRQLGSASLANINIHRLSRTRTRSTHRKADGGPGRGRSGSTRREHRPA